MHRFSRRQQWQVTFLFDLILIVKPSLTRNGIDQQERFLEISPSLSDEAVKELSIPIRYNHAMKHRGDRHEEQLQKAQDKHQAKLARMQHIARYGRSTVDIT
jgi:hypothetical protein